MSDKIINIHHLNAATLCPLIISDFFKQVRELSNKLSQAVSWRSQQNNTTFHTNIANSNSEDRSLDKRLVCHCVLIETRQKLILLDTGLARTDIEQRGKRLPTAFMKVIGRPILDINQTAYHQIQALGYSPSDVSDIIVTHLDIDHAGGLIDFPQAKVHLLNTELNTARHPQTFIQKQRYTPAIWRHNPNWQAYEYHAGGEQWNGFESLRNLAGLPTEVMLLPMRGHTQGHTGIAVDNGGSSLLFVGDAYVSRKQLSGNTPPEIAIFNQFLQEDLPAFKRNLARISELKQKNLPGLKIFCSHDPKEYRQCCG